jgi:PAS domain S-box-containing protein
VPDAGAQSEVVVTAWAPADTPEGIRALLNALPAMVGYWDRDLRNRLANDAYVEYFGRSPEQMRGLHMREVLGPELFAKNWPFIERVLAGEPQLFDREIPVPAGEPRYTQASYIPDVAQGVVRGFFVLVTDITERHRAELALHASEERYRTLVEHLPGSAITLVGPDLRLRWFGGGVPSAAGLDVESMLGRLVREASGGGEHGLQTEGLYRRALSGEEVSAEVHSRVTGRDFSLQIAPLRAPDGTVTEALGVAQDITDRKRAEQALADERRLLAEAEAVARMGSWEWDIADNRVRWSDGLLAIHGMTRAQAPREYEPDPDHVHPDDRDRVVAAVRRALETGTAFELDYRIIRSDGRIRVLHGRGEAIVGEDGKPVRMAGTARDITEAREAESTLSETAGELTRHAAELERLASTTSQPKDAPDRLLSPRQLEVLALVAEGLSNEEIAARLFLTESTVKWHVAQITRRLGVSNRAQAVARYLRPRTAPGG